MQREEMNKAIGLTEDEMDKLSEEWESDTWEGKLGEVVMGRPKLYDEDMETVTFRLPLSRIHAMDSVSKRRGETRSEFLRKAVDNWLIVEAKVG